MNLELIKQVIVWAYTYGSTHETFLMFFFMATVSSMHPRLPSPWNKIDTLEWLYEWTRHTAIALITFQRPNWQSSNPIIDAKWETVEIHTPSLPAENGGVNQNTKDETK